MGQLVGRSARWRNLWGRFNVEQDDVEERRHHVAERDEDDGAWRAHGERPPGEAPGEAIFNFRLGETLTYES